jgi:hypothetical protein
MSMREFSDKHGGDIRAALRSLSTQNLGGEQDGPGEIDKQTRKRKWAASIDVEKEAESRPSKSGG